MFEGSKPLVLGSSRAGPPRSFSTGTKQTGDKYLGEVSLVPCLYGNFRAVVAPALLFVPSAP